MKSNVIKKLQILRGEPRHSSLFPECLALVDCTQGRGIFSLDYFDRCVSESNRLLLIALLEGRLVGVASARVLPADGFGYYSLFGQEAIALFEQHQVGSMETASVLESFQGQGVGQELARHRIQWLKKMGCGVVIGVSWESGLPNTSDRVFAKLGFQRLSRAKEFYREDSVRRGFICPVCGPPPCRCPASLFVKLLSP